MRSWVFRIGVAQVSCESNHFVSTRAETEFFRTSGYLHAGEAVRSLQTADNEVGGALSVFAAAPGATVVPLLAARGALSGPLSAACFREVKQDLLARISASLPLDGLMLSHHGSMCSEDVDDTEGDIISQAREIVGPAAIIAVTVDLHANVTRKMVEAADVIVGYKHYPHDDARQTGERAARLLLRALRGEISPVSAYLKLPMLLTAFHASTASPGPYAQLMDRTIQLEASGKALSASVFFVGSYIDVPEIGCGTLAITDSDAAGAEAMARSLADDFWRSRGRFKVATCSVAEAVRQGRAISGGPVLLLDTADTVGGGAAGDSIGLLRGLMEAGVTEPCLLMVVDPVAAAECVQAGIGGSVSVSMGHRVDPVWGAPLDVKGIVRRISDGRFRYAGGILAGATASMGRSAVLELGSIQVLVMTSPTYDWGREQYESTGLDVSGFKFVGVKNMMNFRVGYADVMKGYFVLDLPGPTPPDMRQLPFKRVRRPLYPFDDVDIPPELTIGGGRPQGATRRARAPRRGERLRGGQRGGQEGGPRGRPGSHGDRP